jgi:uncharacterized membrane protein
VGSVLVVAIAIGLVAIGYPLAIDRLQLRFGTRPLAAVMAALFGLAVFRSWLAARRGSSVVATRGLVISLGCIGALLVSLAMGDARFMRLVPAWVYLGLALFCFGDARNEEPFMERGIRLAIPGVPPFIRDYCRGLTVAWGVFFLVCAAGIATLALTASAERWRIFSTRDLFIGMALVSLVEFFVRKTWFRYYYWNGPFERFWSRLFPAEQTEAGRRSLAYIEDYRKGLAHERASTAEASSE